MIQILLLIIKIIGIILLVLFGLLLLAIALVLFVPVCYRAKIIHNPEKTEIKARISFLFPLLIVGLHYLETFSYKVRVFGYAILDSNKPKKTKQKKEKPKKKMPEASKHPVRREDSSEQPKQEAVEDTREKQTAVSGKTVKEEETEIKAELPKKEKKQKKEKKSFGERLEQLKVLWHRKEEVQRILEKTESRWVISFVWKKCKHLFRHILPRKIKGYVAYGSSDPATTGKVLGIISVIYAKTGPLVELRPNFEEEQLECDLELKGHIQLFTLLVIAAKVFFNKELRQMIEELKQVKEIT